MLVWDVTCPDTFAPSYLAKATSGPGLVFCWEHKEVKIQLPRAQPCLSLWLLRPLVHVVPSPTASWQTLATTLYVPQEITMPHSTCGISYPLPYEKGERNFHIWVHAAGGIPVVVRCIAAEVFCCHFCIVNFLYKLINYYKYGITIKTCYLWTLL